MKYTKLAIERAVMGGYFGEEEVSKIGTSTMDKAIELTVSDGQLQKTLLERKFWQALGKTEGWKNTMEIKYFHYDGQLISYRDDVLLSEFHQHRLIDAINEGQTYEQFFKSILKK